MSKDWQKDTLDFNTLIGRSIQTRPGIPSEDDIRMNIAMLKEEFLDELIPSLEKMANTQTWDNDNFIQNLVDVMDGVLDTIYYLLGVPPILGVNSGPIWDAIHESNMLKFSGKIREDGKREKPADWKHPDIKALIEEQLKV